MDVYALEVDMLKLLERGPLPLLMERNGSKQFAGRRNQRQSLQC